MNLLSYTLIDRIQDIANFFIGITPEYLDKLDREAYELYNVSMLYTGIDNEIWAGIHVGIGGNYEMLLAFFKQSEFYFNDVLIASLLVANKKELRIYDNDRPQAERFWKWLLNIIDEKKIS